MDAHNENDGTMGISENEQTLEQEQEPKNNNNTENCDNNCPPLKYQGITPLPETSNIDQTPITKAGNKRSCVVLSPPIEEDQIQPTMSVENRIQKSLAEMLPTIVETIRCEIRNTISEIVEKKTEDLKLEMDTKYNFELEKQQLKTLSETELLETYNRRDNVKIIGLPEQKSRENYKETAELVIDLAKEMKYDLDPREISIAHRLPKNKGVRPIIAKFVRRNTKIDLLINKRNLKNSEKFRNVRVYEDMSKARLNFLNLMRTDKKIFSAWSRDGNLFYQVTEGSKIFKITDLYEGGLKLGYSLSDVLHCFGLKSQESNARFNAEQTSADLEASDNQVSIRPNPNSMFHRNTLGFQAPNEFQNQSREPFRSWRD